MCSACNAASFSIQMRGNYEYTRDAHCDWDSSVSTAKGDMRQAYFFESSGIECSANFLLRMNYFIAYAKKLHLKLEQFFQLYNESNKALCI